MKYYVTVMDKAVVLTPKPKTIKKNCDPNYPAEHYYVGTMAKCNNCGIIYKVDSFEGIFFWRWANSLWNKRKFRRAVLYG